jgi:hypothetical protein
MGLGDDGDDPSLKVDNKALRYYIKPAFNPSLGERREIKSAEQLRK